MQRHPGRQSSSQTPYLVGTLAPKPEGVEQLVVDRLYDLTNAGDPSPEPLGPGLLGVALGWMDDLGSVAFQPTSMVLFSLEAFVCDVGPREGRARAFESRVGVSPQREEGLGQWLIGGRGRAETENRYYPGGLYSDQKREALVPPYSVGPTDVGLPGEPAVTPALAVSDGHRRAIQGLVRALSGVREEAHQMQHESLDELRAGAHKAVELGTLGQGREGVCEAARGVAIEVPLAVETAPTREDGEGDDLAFGEGRIGTGTPSWWSGLAKVVDHNVECGEEGVHIDHDRLDSGLSPATVQKIHAVLHKALDQAASWSLVPRNPTESVKAPRPAPEEIRPLNREQAKALLEMARRERFEALYVLAVTTGLRQGELLGLKWEDVDLENSLIRVRRTLIRNRGRLLLGEPKTKRSRRTVRLTEAASQALKEHLARQIEQMERLGDLYEDQGLIFATQRGTLVNPTNLRKRSFAPILEKAGLLPIRFHDLRHTCATLLLSRNVNPKIVSEMLGHATIAITLDTYSHVLPTMPESAA